METVLKRGLRYSPFERLPIRRPVHRIDYLVSRVAGKRVLDLGALDETELVKEQHSRWRWLHGEMREVASAIVGIDQSPHLLQSPSATIRHGSVEDLRAVVEEFSPEIIVAGELIEHTPNTLGWLTALSHLAPGKEILLTTPNATSLINIVLAFLSRENCHQDHLQVYSYKTLSTLGCQARIDPLTLVPYYYDPQLFFGRLGGRWSRTVSAVEWGILRPIQYLFPLTSFGLIVDGRLKDGER